jgi:hypothetical protein
LTYLNNRYYDPQLGVFLSVDPLVATTGDPYLYANGNPTTLSDPTGLMPDGFSSLYVSRNEFGGWTVGSSRSLHETNWRNQTVSGWDLNSGHMSFPAGSMQANVARQRDACNDSSQPFMCMAAAMTGGGMDATSAESLALDIAWAHDTSGVGGPSWVDSGGVVADEWGNFVQDTIVTLGVSAAAKWILGFGGAAASATAATETADDVLEAVAPRVTFGHGARHLEGTGLSSTQVESTILQRVTAEASQASTTGSFWGRVRINGTTIEYRAYTLPDGTINVGTYYVP